MKKTMIVGLLLVALTWICAPAAFAQGVTITVTSSRGGTVKPVGDVAVLIGKRDSLDLEYQGPHDVLKKNDRTSLIATTRTDRNGVAKIPVLPAGAYTIVLWKKNYTPSIEYFTYPQLMQYDLILDDQPGNTGRHQTLSY